MNKDSSNSPASKRKWPQYRSKHRQRSHDQAHADVHSGDVQTIDHVLVANSPPAIVATPSDLHQLVEHLRDSGSFGYDSEFIGEHSYYPELCVIQVASPQRVALIDPLAKLDLTPFWELLHDAAVEKIVHAGEPDLEPVARHLGKPPQSIFDTQIAAAFSGGDRSYPMALGKLLVQLTGKELMHATRGLKFSQWNRRPLSSAQLRYAADDVRYLPLIRHLLGEHLAATGNTRWAMQECQSLSSMQRYVFDPQSQRIRVRGVDKLSKRKREVLRALIAWRDASAREQDVPPRSLLRDDVLFALANSPAQGIDHLKAVSGMPRPVVQQYGETIVHLTANALEASTNNQSAPPTELERRHYDREALRRRVDEIWSHINQRCSERSIDPTIATSKRELDLVIRAADADQDVTDHRLFNGWRFELFGLTVDSMRPNRN